MPSLLREALPIILVFLGLDGFFIFIIYLISPGLMGNLIAFILLFTSLSVALIIIRLKARNKRRKAYLEDFMERPSFRTRDRLVKEFGADYDYIFSSFLELLKDKDMALEKSRSALISYRNFIEMWAHEIKTPLAFSNLFLENHRKSLDSDFLDKLGLANSNIENYINQILYYARISSSKKDYKMEELSLKSLVADAIKSYYPLIAEEGILIKEDISDSLVFTDKNTAIFIISQILSNAIKYSEGKISIYNKAKSLYIGNNGPKVQGQDLPFIFEKAFTGEVDKIHKSTGMGLYLSRLYASDLSIGIEVVENTDGNFLMVLNF